MDIVFEFLSGARAGQRVTLPGRDRICIGRRPENDLVFDAQRDLDVSGGRANQLLVAKQLAGYNFGIRIDTAAGLARQVEGLRR